MSIEGTLYNIVKAIYNKHTANIIFNNEKLKNFLLRSVTGKAVHSDHFYTAVLEVLDIELGQEIRKIRSQIITICRWHDAILRKITKTPRKTALETINF